MIIDIIDLRLSYVAETYQGIKQAADNLGLQMNEAKTKLMVATPVALLRSPNFRKGYEQIVERTFEFVQDFTAKVKGRAQGCWLPTGHFIP